MSDYTLEQVLNALKVSAQHRLLSLPLMTAVPIWAVDKIVALLEAPADPVVADPRQSPQDVYWKLLEEPTWQPYCLGCRTMKRMARAGDTFTCSGCGMVVDLAMRPVAPAESKPDGGADV